MCTKTFVTIALAAAALPAAHAEFVYDNSSGDLNTRLSIGNTEIGDEIILGGTMRTLSQFDFQYYGISFSGNEQARVRFYLNDGTAWGPNANRPLTAFYDSGLFNVSATPRSTLNFSVADGSLPSNLPLPERFTVSIQFSGIDTGAGEAAGLDLYNPPSVGSAFDDYWVNDGVSWNLQTNGTFALNPAFRIQAVPEPSFLALALLGGVSGLALIRRRKR